MTKLITTTDLASMMVTPEQRARWAAEIKSMRANGCKRYSIISEKDAEAARDLIASIDFGVDPDSECDLWIDPHKNVVQLKPLRGVAGAEFVSFVTPDNDPTNTSRHFASVIMCFFKTPNPSSPGICTSRNTRSGECSLIKATASTPFLPCPITLISGKPFKRNASSSRAGFSSSTMMVFIVMLRCPCSRRSAAGSRKLQ